MKLAFTALLVLHGLLHGFGFVKAYGLAEVAQLHTPISRPVGALWLAAALAFVATAALLFASPKIGWAVAVLAALLSQALIVSSWGDAKFGTVVNVIVLAAVAYRLSARGMLTQF